MINTKKAFKKIKLNVKTILENTDVLKADEENGDDVIDDEPRSVPKEKPIGDPVDIKNAEPEQNIIAPESDSGGVIDNDEPQPEEGSEEVSEQPVEPETESALTNDHKNAIQTWLLDKDPSDLTNQSFDGLISQRNASEELSYNFIFKMAKNFIESKLNSE